MDNDITEVLTLKCKKQLTFFIVISLSRSLSLIAESHLILQKYQKMCLIAIGSEICVFAYIRRTCDSRNNLIEMRITAHLPTLTICDTGYRIFNYKKSLVC